MFVSQDEILDYIRNEDYAGLLKISSVFRTRFKDEKKWSVFKRV